MQKAGKLESIEVARAIATSLVIINHIAIDSKFWLGFEFFSFDFPCMRAAIIFFFVLSGFIMCYAHWDDMGRGYPSIKDYFAKRITRIFPTYWLILFIVTLSYVYLRSRLNTNTVDSHLMTLQLTWTSFIKNIFLINYPDNSIVLVAWTMQFEIIFYLIFSFFMINVRLGIVVFAVWLFAVILFNANYIHSSSYFIKFLCDTCNGQLIFGCFIAYILSKWQDRHYFMPIVSTILGLSGLIVTGAIDVFSNQLLSTMQTTLLYTLSSFFCILGLVKMEFIKKIRCPSLLVTLGLASYPIYLTHHLTQSLLFRLAHYANIGSQALLATRYTVFVFLIFIFSLWIGYLFYKFYDKPVTSYIRRKLKERALRIDEVNSGEGGIRTLVGG